MGVGKESGARLTVLVFSLVVKCVGRIKFEPGGGSAVGGEDDWSSIEEALLLLLAAAASRRFEGSMSINFEEDWVRLRSMRIFLQISRRRFAMARAGTSHLNT